MIVSVVKLYKCYISPPSDLTTLHNIPQQEKYFIIAILPLVVILGK